MVFHIYTFRKPNISLAPENTKNDDVPKIQNRAYLAKTWFFLRFYVSQNLSHVLYYLETIIFAWNFRCHTRFWEQILDQKLCNLRRTERFGGSPKRAVFLASFGVQKSYAFCEGWNDLGDRKSDIFAHFWHKVWFYSYICLPFGATRSASVI